MALPKFFKKQRNEPRNESDVGFALLALPAWPEMISRSAATFRCYPNDHLVGGFKHEFYFPFHIWDNPNPIDFHIFQRGRLNHQPVTVGQVCPCKRRSAMHRTALWALWAKLRLPRGTYTVCISWWRDASSVIDNLNKLQHIHNYIYIIYIYIYTQIHVYVYIYIYIWSSWKVPPLQISWHFHLNKVFFPNQESPTSMMSLSFGLFPPCSPGERCQYRRERGFEHQERRSTVSSWGLTIPSIFLWGWNKNMPRLFSSSTWGILSLAMSGSNAATS